MRIFPPRVTAFGVLFALIGPASAQSLNEILAPVSNAEACWKRTYANEHLAKHPQQKVTNISFNLGYFEMDHQEAGDGDYSFSIDIKTRGQKGSVGGVCYMDDQNVVMCGGDCDSGVVSVHASGSSGSLLLRMESSGLSLTDCGGDTKFWMSAEPDDKAFLVHPAPCSDSVSAPKGKGS